VEEWLSQKPFSMELIIRIQALLHRNELLQEETILKIESTVLVG
jgi:DNA-binding response OmpR family regulator